MSVINRVKQFLSNLPNRSKRINEKFTLTTFKNNFRQDSLLDKMKGSDSHEIPRR